MTASIKQAAPGSLSPPRGEAAGLQAARLTRERAVLAWFVAACKRSAPLRRNARNEGCADRAGGAARAELHERGAWQEVQGERPQRPDPARGREAHAPTGAPPECRKLSPGDDLLLACSRAPCRCACCALDAGLRTDAWCLPHGSLATPPRSYTFLPSGLRCDCQPEGLLRRVERARGHRAGGVLGDHCGCRLRPGVEPPRAQRRRASD